jgi:CheY-like chemotaxis protein
MTNQQYPFAVRLIGFPKHEEDLIDLIFAIEEGKGYRYFRLTQDNLQDPDLFLANADDDKAMLSLADLHPTDVRPAALVGAVCPELAYPCVERPIGPHKLFEALDSLIEKRADALSRLQASDIVIVPERRRRDRIGLAPLDPAEYERMRSKPPVEGRVLVVDKNPVFSNYVKEFLARRDIPVTWTNNEAQAIELSRTEPASIVLINTSTPNIDPYHLCQSIKARTVSPRATVILLLSKPYVYDPVRARNTGVEGFMNKPLSVQHLTSLFKKFLPPRQGVTC